MMFLVFALFLIRVFLRGEINETQHDCEPTNISYLQMLSLGWQYTGFSSVSQLRMDCDVISYSDIIYDNYSYFWFLEFKFDSVERYNQTLDLTPFTGLQKVINIQIRGIKKIDLEMNAPMFSSNNSFDTTPLIGMLFDFQFYLNGSLVDERMCRADIFEKMDLRLFGGLAYFQLSIDRTSELLVPWCPYVFKNAEIGKFKLTQDRDSLFLHHSLRFYDIKNPNNESVNLHSWIFELMYLQVFNLRLDEKSLNVLVYKKIFNLEIQGTLSSIRDDIFKNFQELIKFDIDVANFRDFIHASNNKWLAHLYVGGETFRTKTDMINRKTEYYFSLSISQSTGIYWYKFPGEDFCLFKYFPAKKAIASFLLHKDLDLTEVVYLKNESTIRFLTQNVRFLYTPENSTQNDSVQQVPSSTDDTEFDEKLNACINVSFENISKRGALIYFSYYDLNYVLNWLEFIGPVITFPILCLLAFVFNLLVILIIANKENKKAKLFDSLMFEYIRINSTFICIECLIYPFRLMAMCQDTNTLMLCSSVRTSAVRGLFHDILFPAF